ncbi:MAG: hypothetical protein PHT12_05700 [Patescibacteria group bacterium]|nr:hypothetical protein [Patescibacteria group bacterium]
MPKICSVCDYVPEFPAKPDEEPEDCPQCGGKGTVQYQEEDESEEE